MEEQHGGHKNVNRLIIAIETVALVASIVALIYISIHRF